MTSRTPMGRGSPMQRGLNFHNVDEDGRQPQANPPRSKLSSRVGSVTSVSSSTLQKNRVNCDLQKKLADLEDQEDELIAQGKVLDAQIQRTRLKVKDTLLNIEDIKQFGQDEGETFQLLQNELMELKVKLSQLEEQKEKDEIEFTVKTRSIQRRRLILTEEAKLDIDEIEENADVGNVRDFQDESNGTDPDQLQLYANSSAEEIRKQNEELRKNQETEDEKAKVKADTEHNQTTVKADSVKSVSVNEVSIQDTPTSAVDQLALSMVAALNRMNPVKNPPDQGRMFMARQSSAKDLQHFSGKAEDWLSFHADFIRSTKDCGFSDSENLTRLRKCLQGDAAKFVKRLMISPDNVPTIIKKLQIRFGQPDLIIDSMIEKAQEISPFQENQLEVFIEFGSAVQDVVTTVENMNQPAHLCNPHLLKTFEKKLPNSLLMQWLNYADQGEGRKRDLINFSNWIEKQTTLACQVCPPRCNSEILTTANKGQKSQPVQGKPKPEPAKKVEDVPTAAGLFVGNKSTKNGPDCIFCNQHYNTAACVKAMDMPLEEKLKIVKDKRCCHVCLKPYHIARDCKAVIKCPVCKKKHLAFMCPDLHKLQKTEPDKEEKIEAPEVRSVQTNLSCSGTTFLDTLMVTIVGKTSTKKVRALFDSGAQRSYVLKKVVKELELSPDGDEEVSHSLFSGVQTEARKYKRYSLKVKTHKGNGLVNIQTLEQDGQICGPIPSLKPGPWMKGLKKRGIWFSDVSNSNQEIGLLIGNDFMKQIMTGEPIRLDNGLTAQEGSLGWIISGNIKFCAKLDESSSAMTVTSLSIAQSSVKDLWDLEAIGIQDPSETKSKKEKEDDAKMQFLQTVSRSEDGRYTVELPWMDGRPKIPDNRSICEKRLETTTNKLIKEGNYHNYNKIFLDWEKDGIIEVVPEEEIANRSHYIPHRAVVKLKSLTTPIRPVFDASCKAYRSPSLNECLEKGPNLLELIPAILLRFREKKFGMIGDIKKAFLMINIKKEDTDFLRFLWWKDASRMNYKIYRHRRVVFGATCSPFLLAAVLEYHLGKVEPEEQQISDKLLRSLYVDNCVTSEDSLNECLEFRDWAVKIMAEAKMELRQWEGGSGEKSGVGLSSGCGLDFAGTTSVLGYKWNKESDSLSCDFNLIEDKEVISKRMVLSYIQRVYDPIGFTCPATLVPKMLMQKLWNEDRKWDEPLSENDVQDFRKWCEELSSLQQISIPRNMTGYVSLRNKWQLHTFCDASHSAYAAVVFLRTVNEDGEVSVQLLAAKARVAPLKKTTIPRLELLGCLIAAILTDSVKNAISIEDVPTYFWSDSMTALAWIKRNDAWGTFVGNRVKVICSLTKVENWRHIPGVSNPADLPSRGCSPSELLRSRWWEGPTWLKGPPSEWPTSDSSPNEEEIVEERKKVISSMLVETTSATRWYCCKSSFRFNIKIIAWCLRFLDNTRRIPRSGPLTIEELENAEKTIIRLVQIETFTGSEEVIGGVRVERGPDGLIRVKTKISFREDTPEFRKPLLLPFDHPVTDQIIREVHLLHRHAGAQFLMSKIREKFWILKGRRAIKRVIGKCVACLRYTSKKNCVPPGPLPLDRVSSTKVFEVIGVDLAGPLYLKGGEKTWIVLYTCAVYRCIHLELIRSLSTDEFMNSFTRFTSRRGRPVIVYSDNGTNFVGADNALGELDWDRIVNEYKMERITWKFNPPSAPWWGGFWERLVRSIKDLLRRSLGKSKLNYNKLMTLICEIESIINMRPLTFVTEDSSDLVPLTPAMFLHELPNSELSDQRLLEASGFRKAYEGRKTILEELKMRFRKEYLSLLVQRGKDKSRRKFEVGDVVLVEADNKKRWEWPMAVILDLMPGRDGNVRVARVKTATGTFTRPLQRLYYMEISSPEDIPEFPKSMEMPLSPEEDDVEIQKEVKVCVPDNELPPEVRTRAGRLVKAPERLEL